MRFPDDKSRALGPFLEALPPGSVVDVAPGLYPGPLRITRPVTLRGAGELTRIHGGDAERPMTISVASSGRVVLDSLRLERGRSADGGGLLIAAGDVELLNVHIQRSVAAGNGGAVAVAGGTVLARRLFTSVTSAQRGGAVWVGHRGRFVLRESQVERSEADFGGAIAVEDAGTVEIDGATIRRARARSGAGGQAFYVRGSDRGRPQVRLVRVRVEAGRLGVAVVIDPAYPAEISLEACDMPRAVKEVPGLVDGGANHWH